MMLMDFVIGDWSVRNQKSNQIKSVKRHASSRHCYLLDYNPEQSSYTMDIKQHTTFRFISTNRVTAD